jgi:hypothetical protein
MKSLKSVTPEEAMAIWNTIKNPSARPHPLEAARQALDFAAAEAKL